jgi:CcmD family protein
VEGSLVYLFAALAIVWVVIVGYLVILSGRVSALQRDLDALKHGDSWRDDDRDDAPEKIRSEDQPV